MTLFSLNSNLINTRIAGIGFPITALSNYSLTPNTQMSYCKKDFYLIMQVTSFDYREFGLWNNIPMAFLVLKLCKQTKDISYDGILLISMTLNQDIVRIFEKGSY